MKTFLKWLLVQTGEAVLALLVIGAVFVGIAFFLDWMIREHTKGFVWGVVAIAACYVVAWMVSLYRSLAKNYRRCVEQEAREKAERAWEKAQPS